MPIKRADYPHRFDVNVAEKWCKFIELLPHTKGEWARKGEKLRLEPWQCFKTICLMGWLRKQDGLRRYRKALILEPRKNAKSTWAAGIGLGMLTIDSEHGAEVYSGATTEKQAWEVFKPARLMAQKSPALLAHFGVSVNAKNIHRLGDVSKFEPLIGDPGDGASTQPTLLEWGSISLGNGRWLIWMRTNEVGGNFYLAPSYTASGYLFQSATFPYDGVAGIVVHGIEVEDGPFLTSGILAGEAATATRAADLPQIPIGFLPFNMAAGTMIWKGMAFDYDGGGQALGQPSMRFYRSTTQYAFIAKSDVTARNSQATFTARAANVVGVEDSQTLSLPVSSPSILAMSWDEQRVIGVSGRTGTILQSPTGPGPVFDPTRLEFQNTAGIAWHQFGIIIPRKLSGPYLLQRVRA